MNAVGPTPIIDLQGSWLPSDEAGHGATQLKWDMKVTHLNAMLCRRPLVGFQVLEGDLIHSNPKGSELEGAQKISRHSLDV
jgi:hypothetical protein